MTAMKKEMLINVLQPEECRIAILEDGVLEELYVERTSHESYVGNIYKGRIVNIEPSIQAAFVDFGVGRNGFLHVSDVEPEYYRHLEQRRGDRDRNGRERGRDRQPPRRPEESHRERVQEISLTDAETPTEKLVEDVYAIVAADRTDELNLLSPLDSNLDSDAHVGIASPTATEPPPPEDIEAAPEAAPMEIEAPVEGAEERGRRRRGRGRGGRTRRGRSSKASEKTSEPSGADTQNPPAERDNDSDADEDARSEPMQSAERRTREHEPSDPSPSSAADKVIFSDEDLSFSRARPPVEGQVSTALDEKDGGDNLTDKPLSAVLDAKHADIDDAIQEASSPAPVAEVDFESRETPAEPEDDDVFARDVAEDRMRHLDDDESGESGPGARRGQRRGERGGSRGQDRGGDRRRRRPMSGRPGAGRPKPLIQDIFKRGQEVLVQVIKEGIGTKGPTLSTYISIAGRYLVLMPGLKRIGVSRKIDDDEQRRRLREILHELKPPHGLGFIIRTAGLDRTKKELQRDLAYLSRLWQVVARRIRKMKAPAEIYQESDMIIRTIRDTFTSEIDTIWVDEPNAFAHAQEFLQIVMPRYASRINCYSEPEPMFHKYGIEDEIARIQRRHVPLPMGGSIVIDQTEALVAIDVNSGNFRADNNAEETAYQMNIQAAKEIARQLRLRDLGGVIVNDFIDMRDEKHRRGVEKAMRDAVKRDRARTKILKISQFGIIEMTRQRIRPSLKRSVYQECPHCKATGQVKTTESMSIDVMRMLQLAAHRPSIQRIDIKVHQDVANYLQNRKRKAINHLEESGGSNIYILGDPLASPEMLEFECYDNNNNEVKFTQVEEPVRPRRR
jgi:ribonuclease E